MSEIKLKIVPPEGYEIDVIKSTYEEIVFCEVITVEKVAIDYPPGTVMRCVKDGEQTTVPSSGIRIDEDGSIYHTNGRDGLCQFILFDGEWAEKVESNPSEIVWEEDDIEAPIHVKFFGPDSSIWSDNLQGTTFKVTGMTSNGLYYTVEHNGARSRYLIPVGDAEVVSSALKPTLTLPTLPTMLP